MSLDIRVILWDNEIKVLNGQFLLGDLVEETSSFESCLELNGAVKFYGGAIGIESIGEVSETFEGVSESEISNSFLWKQLDYLFEVSQSKIPVLLEYVDLASS